MRTENGNWKLANIDEGNSGRQPPRRPVRKTYRFWIVLAYLALILSGALMLLPSLAMIGTSLKSGDEIVAKSSMFIPNKIRWENYSEAIERFPFFRSLWNTLVIVFFQVVGTLLSCTLAAWGFAKYRTKLGSLLFALCLAPMLLPPQVTIIPVFLGFVELGLYDTYVPLILPAWLGMNVFNIFLLRQFFRAIPDELLDAARIDGCNELGLLWHIAVPLSRPVLWVIAVFTFIAGWNDYFGPLIYLADEAKYPVSIGLTAFQQNAVSPIMGVEWNLLMAASFLLMIPVIALFFVAQKAFVENVTLSGIKG